MTDDGGMRRDIKKTSGSILVLPSLHIGSVDNLTNEQCDRTAQLFFQYLTIYRKDIKFILPKEVQNLAK